MQARGHELLSEGDYPQAISQLRAALTASGGTVVGCAEPATEACLTYAYALYDLGRALRLDGQTASALAVLGERLQIDNQRPVVETEIALARGTSGTAEGGTVSGPPPQGPAARPRQDKQRRAHAGLRHAHGHVKILRASGAIAAAPA
jgi:hypothetical protein